MACGCVSKYDMIKLSKKDYSLDSPREQSFFDSIQSA